MARSVNTQVTVSFESDEGEEPTLILEESDDDMTSFDAPIPGSDRGGNGLLVSPGFGWRALRLFPDLNADVVTSRGFVEFTGRSGQLERDEFVRFAGSDRGSVRYPIWRGDIQVDIEFAIDTDGNEIPPSKLSFRATKNKTDLIANRAFFGAIRIRYIAAYKICRYAPVAGQARTAQGRGFYRNFGMVLATFQRASATLDIDPPTWDNPESTLKELYRVVSYVQVNNNGAWEKHPDFDTGGSWSDPDAPTEDDDFLEYERVHEIGYVESSPTGRIATERSNPPTEQGPGTGFTPQYLYRFTPGNQFIDTPWQDAYARINLGSVLNDIESRFPNVEEL